jgi:hypothetical protein
MGWRRGKEEKGWAGLGKMTQEALEGYKILFHFKNLL